MKCKRCFLTKIPTSLQTEVYITQEIVLMMFIINESQSLRNFIETIYMIRNLDNSSTKYFKNF